MAELCLCPNVLQKLELVSNEIRYLAGYFKQNVKGTAWLLLTVYTKMQEDRNDLMMKSLIKKKTELKDLEHSQPFHMVKNEKAS